MRGGMRGQHGDASQILNRLVSRYVPLIVHPVQVAQVPGQTRTHANKFISKLVETLCGYTLLESHSGNQLLVNGGVGLRISHIQHLSLQLIGRHGLHKQSLLFGDTRHIQHRPTTHQAARSDGYRLLCRAFGELSVNDDAMARGCKRCGISHGVVNIAYLKFRMRICIKRAVLRKIGIFEGRLRMFVTSECIKQHIVAFAVLQLVDEALAFGNHQR